MYELLWDFLIITGTVFSFVLMFSIRTLVKKGTIDKSSFTQKEKMIVALLAVSSPIISGIIFYYGLINRSPKKAKVANFYSITAFLIIVSISIIITTLHK